MMTGRISLFVLNLGVICCNLGVERRQMAFPDLQFPTVVYLSVFASKHQERSSYIYGNRLKKSRLVYDCVEQIFIVPSCCFSLHFYTRLVRYLFDNIEHSVTVGPL